MWVIAEISVPSVKRFGGVVCAQRTRATPPLSGCPTCQEAGSDSVNMAALVRLQVQSRVCALRLVQLHRCSRPFFWDAGGAHACFIKYLERVDAYRLSNTIWMEFMPTLIYPYHINDTYLWIFQQEHREKASKRPS